MQLIKKLGYFCAFSLPLLLLAGYYLGTGWLFMLPIFVFFIVPLIDILLGTDTSNIAEPPSVAAEFYYLFLLYFWALIQSVLLIWACYEVTFANWNLFQWVGMVLGMGIITGGIGITVAHELGHKKSAAERFLSKVLLSEVCYTQFYIEHNRGHHVHVGTPSDPATSRKNESFYRFWKRSVFEGFSHAWKIENERLAKKGQATFSFSNEMLGLTLAPLVLAAVFTLVFSLMRADFVWEVPVFFFAQSIFAFSLLEGVNYIEHYGLMRKELAPNKYEKVNTLHSWNSSQLLSNFFLFQLQRHSDHHIFPARRYQVLDHHDESPQLPTGYPGMLLLAMIPPIWFRVMNKKLEEWEGKVKS
ncbi:alkane 1-monooxygenase [Solitalea sp. MAHUQ-68]|uniref:Alkane 1-monooxygenase n=1 Tax=Solitalea agri TaxID=2953739 RepID=A0A9X2F2S6_9SPHI|nr:alkane 1-monooxygenase [Solitalea agri]MCO4293166.1 alkane 1-monooxygenase [Solitalea agri]